MNPAVILKALSRRYSQLSEIQAIRGGYKPLIFADYLVCNLLNGSTYEDYEQLGLWRMSQRERRGAYTTRRVDTVNNRYNDRQRHLCLSSKKAQYELVGQHIHRCWIPTWLCDEEEFKTFVSRFPRIIVKPDGGMMGQGVRIIDLTGATPGAVTACYQQLHSQPSHLLAEQMLANHPAMQFGNEGLNTMRIITLRHLDGRVEVLCAALRVGSNGSLTDNLATGGVAYPIDPCTGCISGHGRAHDTALHVTHPGTDKIMPGHRIPHLHQALDMVKQLAADIEGLRWIGWDVAVTAEGPVVIELNTRPGCYSLQALHPETAWYRRIKQLMKS